MKVFFIVRLSFFCFSFYVLGQDFENKVYCFRQNKLIKIDSIVLKTKDKEKNKFLNLLPNINYSINQGFSIGVNINSFATYYQQKKQNEIQREILKTKMIQDLENEILSIENQINELKKDSLIIELETENLNVFKQIFEIKKKQFEKNQINLEDFLMHKSKFNTLQKNNINLIFTYENKKKYLLKKLEK